MEEICVWKETQLFTIYGISMTGSSRLGNRKQFGSSFSIVWLGNLHVLENIVDLFWHENTVWDPEKSWAPGTLKRLFDVGRYLRCNNSKKEIPAPKIFIDSCRNLTLGDLHPSSLKVHKTHQKNAKTFSFMMFIRRAHWTVYLKQSFSHPTIQTLSLACWY